MNDEEIIEEPTTEEPTTNDDEVVDEKIIKMRIMILGNSDDSSLDDIFNIKLDEARSVALNTLYPFDANAELPDTWRMNMWLVRCAVELYNRKDSDNVQSYSENGISVSYWSGKISKSLLDELIPKAGVPKERCCCKQ
jgi:hypothetical protein